VDAARAADRGAEPDRLIVSRRPAPPGRASEQDGAMPRPPIHDVPIREEPIRLGQFLKLAGLAEDGGHARALIEDGEVLVNGRTETRRGARLGAGDVVAVGPARARPVRA
jgi:ribosome-associated protein